MKMILSDLYEDLTGSQSQSPPGYRAAATALMAPFMGREVTEGMWGTFDADASAWGALMRGRYGLTNLLRDAIAPDPDLKERAKFLFTANTALENTTEYLNGTFLAITNNSQYRLENNGGENGEEIEKVKLMDAYICAKNFSRSTTILPVASLSDSTRVLLRVPTRRPHDVGMFAQNTRVMLNYTRRIGSDNGIVAFLNGRASGEFYMYGIVFVAIVFMLLLARERNRNEKTQEEMNCIREEMREVLRKHRESLKKLSLQSEGQKAMIEKIYKGLNEAVRKVDGRVTELRNLTGLSIKDLEASVNDGVDSRIGNLEASVNNVETGLLRMATKLDEEMTHGGDLKPIFDAKALMHLLNQNAASRRNR